MVSKDKISNNTALLKFNNKVTIHSKILFKTNYVTKFVFKFTILISKENSIHNTVDLGHSTVNLAAVSGVGLKVHKFHRLEPG